MKKKLFSTVSPGEHDLYLVMTKVAYLHSKSQLIVFEADNKSSNKLFFIKNIYSIIFLSMKIFIILLSTKKLKSLTWKGYSFGVYASASSFRNIKSYRSKIYSVIKFYIASIRILRKLTIADKFVGQIDCALIDHGCYENGIYIEVYSKFGIPIYYNDYPYGLSCAQCLTQSPYSSLMKIPSINEQKNSNKIAVEKMKERLKYDNSIPYLLTEYVQLETIQTYDYLIYTHSFTDAQHNFGDDNAFDNLVSWLECTLSELNNKKVCIKAHPGIYVKDHTSQVVDWDLTLFNEIKEKYKNYENFYFLDKPIRNNELLQVLNPNCIVISHHSNALLEAGFVGFKCITSRYSVPWEKYDIFNSWDSIDSMKNLLNLSYDELKPTKYHELMTYISGLYGIEGGFFGTHWFDRVQRVTGVTSSDLMKDAKLLKISKEQLEEVVKDISDNLQTHLIL